MKKEYELIGKENGRTISCRVFTTEQEAETMRGMEMMDYMNEGVEFTIREKEARIIKVYESFDGSYWYLTEFVRQQENTYSKNDNIYFGYVTLSAMPDCAEWGYISEGEIKSLSPRVWEVKKQDWIGCRDYDKVMAELAEVQA